MARGGLAWLEAAVCVAEMSWVRRTVGSIVGVQSRCVQELCRRDFRKELA